jgi:GAF domain-containing protein
LARIYGDIALTGHPRRFESLAEGLDRDYEVYAWRVGEPELRRVAILFNDISERKRAERHQAILAEVSRELVGLTDVTETIERLGEAIRRCFDVKWCMFAELIEGGETSLASSGWHDADVPSLTGTYRMRDFLTSEELAALLTGEPLAVGDTQTDPRVSAERYGVLGIRSFVIVPLVRSGQWRFQLSIIDTRPRMWRDDEVVLVRELAERIWTRLERAVLRRRSARARRGCGRW